MPAVYIPLCPSCLTELAQEDVYCPECGAPAGADQRIYRARSTPNAAPVPAITCHACGRPLEKEVGVCPTCRAWNGPVATRPNQPKRPPSISDVRYDRYGDPYLPFSKDPTAPLMAGGVAGLAVFFLSWFIAHRKRSGIMDVAEDVYREECLGFIGRQADWCGGGIAIAVDMFTPFWAETPFLTGVVAGIIAFVVVLIAARSVQDR